MNGVYPEEAEILRLLGEGLSARAVAERFRLRVSRVQQIRAKATAAAESRRRIEAAQSEMRAANDIERRWPVETVVTALDLGTRMSNCLERCLCEGGRTEASLRAVMDLLLPAAESPPNGMANHPGKPQCTRQGMGRKTYFLLMDALCLMDAGEAFRLEWTARCYGAVEQHWGPNGLLRCAACWAALHGLRAPPVRLLQPR